MKRIKRAGVLWIMMLLIGFCGKVYAADSQADDIIKKANEAMNHVKVYGMEMIVDGKSFLEMSVDQNTQITYMKVSDENKSSSIWIDDKNKMMYMYSEGKYYFQPTSGEDFKTEEEANNFAPALSYSYMGEEPYKNIECYKLTAVSKDMVSYIYYIEKNTYRIMAVIAEKGVNSTISYYSYPESVTIPEEAKQKATLAAGYCITKNKVMYQCHNVKGKPVFYVISASRAKGTVKIADSIQVCGKQYEVYRIDDNALRGNKKITSVVIGKNVRSIGKNAFYGCKKLKMVKINSRKLTKIGSKAFYGNAKKLKFKLPKGKASQYKKLINKSKTKSKVTYSKI